MGQIVYASKMSDDVSTQVYSVNLTAEYSWDGKIKFKNYHYARYVVLLVAQHRGKLHKKCLLSEWLPAD